METKICTKCGRELPATMKYFYLVERGKNGLRSICRNCKKIDRLANKEKISAHNAIYYENNKDKFATYRKANKKKNAAYNVMYRKANMEKIAAYNVMYRKTHKKEVGLWWAKRKAIKRATTSIAFSLKDWLTSQPRPLRCYLCGKLIKNNQKYHIEHRVPLSRGGAHAPWNLSIAHDKCNMAKHTKTPWEYMPNRFQPELPL